MAREIRLIVQARGEGTNEKAWRTAYSSDVIKEDSPTADVIRALDGAVTKIEKMTGRL